MKLFAVSNIYCSPEIAGASFGQFLKTTEDQIDEWFLVNNHWPLSRDYSHDLAGFMAASVFDKGYNLGGHGGTSYGLSCLNFADNDLILNYDLDSWPLDNGWLDAMVDVMEATPNMGWIGLMHEGCKQHTDWYYKEIAGHKVAFVDHPDMWSVTLFRGKMLLGGMLADSTYYGFVETAMDRKAKELGMINGWLKDFRETWHPIPHPQSYNDYKRLHAGKRFLGTYEEYLKCEKST